MQGALPRPGETVWIRRRKWRVDRATRDRELVRLDVSARLKRRTFLEPFDRVFTGRCRRTIHVRPQQALARLAGSLAHTSDRRLPLASIDAGIDILPHQLEPALAVIAGHARVLIADEVGLGKTVQAGIVVADMLRRIPTPRILLIVPASLRDQWQAELRQRFDIDSLPADRVHLQTLSIDGAFGSNPWERAGVWLASTDFVKQPAVLRSLPRDPWDLVVIDEAHAVCGDSDRHGACHELARRARCVLLLTATPHSGDVARFGRLLALGAPKDSSDGLLAFRRTRAGVGLDRRRNVRWHFLQPDLAETAVLDAIDEFEREALSASPPDAIDATRLLVSVFRKRALSTFAALSTSLTRRLLWLGPEAHDDEATTGTPSWTQPRLNFDDEESEAAEAAALTASIGLDAHCERRWLRRLKELADAAGATETKIRRLRGLLARTTEPVIVFSEFRDSVETIATHLHRDRSLAIIHGGQPEDEQRHQLRRYLSGPATVLIATDVAGQGLNLQSRGRWVISLELPWNPARLEQRLGRVDRIGQRGTPHLTLLVTKHPAEAGLLAHMAQRAIAAQRAVAPDLLNDVVPVARVQDATPGPTAIPLCRRWRRAGLVAAKSLQARRCLALRWRGPLEGSGQVVRTRPKCTRGLVLCSIPILNALDEQVDCVRVAVLGAADLCALPAETLARRARERTERVLSRTINKIRLQSLRISARRQDRERRLAIDLRDERLTFEGQPALFDRSALRDHLTRIADNDRVARALDQRLARLAAAASLRAGDLEVDFIIDWPVRRHGR